MIVAKGFVRRCFVAHICANSGAHSHFVEYLCDEAMPNKIVWYKHPKHLNYPKEHTNFDPRFEPNQELDIVKKHENRMHRLTE